MNNPLKYTEAEKRRWKRLVGKKHISHKKHEKEERYWKVK